MEEGMRGMRVKGRKQRVFNDGKIERRVKIYIFVDYKFVVFLY